MPRKDGSTLQKALTAEHEASIVDRMARQGAVLGSTREAADNSWAAVGVDTSMSSIAAVAVGHDAKLDKRVGPTYGEVRWMPEVDYYRRLGEAAKAHDLILSLLRELWVVSPHRVWIAFEEPIHYGTVQRQIGSFIKQQCEVAGACKGSIVRYGFPNIIEINNSQWKKVLRQDGVAFETAPKGSGESIKKLIREKNKMAVKDWAIQAFGLPELPDLVAGPNSAKIPRPASGRGANARAIQPSDIYDGAAICAYMVDWLEQTGVAK